MIRPRLLSCPRNFAARSWSATWLIGLWALSLGNLACERSQPEVKPGENAAANPNVAPAKPAAARPHANGEQACIQGHDKQKGCGAPPAPEEERGHFGDAFQLNQSRSLAEVVNELAKSGKTEATEAVQVSGTIGPVCQRKGCWMVLKDGDTQVRVLTGGSGFSVPTDGTGKSSVVEGRLSSRELSEAQVKHLVDDEGKDPSKVKGPRREYLLRASGVRIF